MPRPVHVCLLLILLVPALASAQARLMLEPAGLEVLPAADGSAPDLVVAGVKWDAGRVIVRDAADNRKVAAMSVPLVSVADVDASVERARANGGRVAVSPLRSWI